MRHHKHDNRNRSSEPRQSPVASFVARLWTWLNALRQWLLAFVGLGRGSCGPNAEVSQAVAEAMDSVERGHLGAAVALLSMQLASNHLRPTDAAAIKFAMACVFAAAGSGQETARLLGELEHHSGATFLAVPELRAARRRLLARVRLGGSNTDAHQTALRELGALLAHLRAHSGWLSHARIPKAHVQRSPSSSMRN